MHKKIFATPHNFVISCKDLASKKRKQASKIGIEIRGLATTCTAGEPTSQWEGYGTPRGMESGIQLFFKLTNDCRQ